MRKPFVLVLVSLFAGYSGAQNPQFCLENDITNRYMNEFTYDDYLDDYDVSKIMEYFDAGKDDGYRLDAPKPVTLSWTKAAGAASQRIEVSESADYADAYVYSVAADAESYDVYNLIPGKTYYYRVISVAGGAESTIKTGAFDTTGKIRMILADGTWNVRDMGGWTSTLTGKPVAYGKIFRGAQLKAKGQDSIILSADGIEALRQVGIRAELDLRSRDNCPVDGSALAKDDGSGKDDVDFLLVPESVNARMYHFQNNDANIRELQWIINHLKQNKPVYFHCQNGADRTGTLGFLIGALLGVSEGDLAKDYELTTFCQEAAVKYDPTEEGFARLRNYTGKKGSPLGSSEDNKEYMFAELANTMKSVAPANGTYQQKIYNFFRTGVNGTKISAADLSWFIMEMTGYPVLGGYNCDVDTLPMLLGDTHRIITTTFPEGADHSDPEFKTTSKSVATVSGDGLVTAVGPGTAYIIVSIDGIEQYIPVTVPVTDDAIPSYSYYNKAVAAYMAGTSYSADDYTTSTVSKYDTINVGYGRKDWPVGFNIKWECFNGTTNLHIQISDNASFETVPVDKALNSTDTTLWVDNLMPGSTYYYRIYADFPDGVTRVMYSSAFRIDGKVLMLKSENLYNIRDLGGWTGMDGYKVKYDVLYRGSRLRQNKSLDGSGKTFTESVRQLKNDYKFNAEIDFRTADDVTATTSVFGNKVQAKYLKVPTANECLGENILSGDAYITAMNSIIAWARLNKKIYLASSLGAERVGTMAFLINGLLGVSESDLAKDYELSSFTEDSLARGKEFKRTNDDYVAMVNKIKTLEGSTLQVKIFNYFLNGVNGTAVAEEDLKWFICYMLDYPWSDFQQTELSVKERKRPIKPRIYSTAGYEVDEATEGLYIIDGNTYLINH